MRKVLSFVLVLSLVLGSFSMAFAVTSDSITVAEFSDVTGTAYEDAVSVLSALDVVTGYPDGTYKPEQTVNRAEMAKLIISELGLESSASGAATNFIDMSGYGWAAGFVGYAQSLGIIEGYGDGTFRPGKIVSYDEAITMIVRAIGYTEDVKEMNGTWPAVFTQKANVLGITDDVKAGGSAGANRGDIAIMLYNALTCNMGYADADGVFINKKDKDDHDIKVITNLDAEESEDYIIITKADADDALVNIKKYIGAYAKVFTMTEGDDEDSIIAMGDVKSTFITGEYKPGDEVIKTIDGVEYKLDDVMDDVAGTSNEMARADIEEAEEFVNSVGGDTGILNPAGTAFDDTADNCMITVAADVSGKTIKGVYSVLKWEVDAEAVVDADDVADIESSHSLIGKDFTENDDDEINLESFELYGVASLSDIKADNVVYVYEADDEIVKVDVGTETVSGEVTRVNNDGDEVTISGKVYKMASAQLANNGVAGELMANDIETEDVVDLVLDAYGFAYDSDVTAGAADTFAIVLETGDEGDRIGDDSQLKLFTNTGDDVVFDVDSDVFDDDIEGYTTDGAWDTDLTAGTFVKYGLDKSGVIDDIEDLTDEDYEIVYADDDDGYDLTAKGYYNGHEVKNNAVIFTYDGDWTTAGAVLSDDEDDYDVTTLDSVLDEEDVVADYVLDDNKIVAMLIYDYSTSDATYGVVTDRGSNNSDAGYEIEFWMDEKTVVYNAEKSEYDDVDSDADVADGFTLWKVELDAGGDISDLTNAWTDSEDTYAIAAVEIEDSTTGAAATTYSGRIFKLVSTDGITEKAGDLDTKNQITLDSDAVVYYSDGGDFEVGSLADLRDVAGKTVIFFDVVDEDGVFDVVLISEDGITFPGYF